MHKLSQLLLFFWFGSYGALKFSAPRKNVQFRKNAKMGGRQLELVKTCDNLSITTRNDKITFNLVFDEFWRNLVFFWHVPGI